jgi:hypothetical protein
MQNCTKIHKQSKQFFFEKKNQKNFCSCRSFSRPTPNTCFMAAKPAIQDLRDCLETQESASFLKKRSKKLLISVGFASVSAKYSRESKFFCFFLFTKRSSYSPFDVSKQPLTTKA